MWVFTGALIWYHTHKHATHSGARKLTHVYNNIYLHYLLCTEAATLND